MPTTFTSGQLVICIDARGHRHMAKVITHFQNQERDCYHVQRVSDKLCATFDAEHIKPQPKKAFSKVIGGAIQ